MEELFEKQRKFGGKSVRLCKQSYAQGNPQRWELRVCNEALYEWWKRKITEEVNAGGRYFSIMALCSYGLKCGISEYKIRRDAYAFLDHLESLTEDEDKIGRASCRERV